MSQHKGLYDDIMAILGYMKARRYPGLQTFVLKGEGWGGGNKKQQGWALTDSTGTATGMVLLKNGRLARQIAKGLYVTREQDDPCICGRFTITYMELVAQLRKELVPRSLIIDMR